MFFFSGWDISSLNLADATERAQVLDYGLQRQLRPHLEKLKPRPSIYCPDFIAANQVDRADNVMSGTKQEMMEQIRMDIRDFKANNNLDKVCQLIASGGSSTSHQGGVAILLVALCYRNN